MICFRFSFKRNHQKYKKKRGKLPILWFIGGRVIGTVVRYIMKIGETYITDRNENGLVLSPFLTSSSSSQCIHNQLYP